MTDLELLERYEPVMRFAKSERFFPMAVEPYLERCLIFPSGPMGAAEALSHIHEPMAERIGKLKSHEHFLRFVNKPLFDFDAWIWWGALSALALGAGWFTLGLTGLEIAIGVSLIAALVIFMAASPIRLRIIPAVLAVIVFLVLGFAPIWLFLNPMPYVSIAIEYLVLLPIYLLLLFIWLVNILRWIIERILPEGPGLVMDMLSQATERIAREAYYQYADILKKHHQAVYYGRVVREEDEAENLWTVLQYHFFYAFNDWRLAANGFNHHEGDWEMAAVYLKNGEPYAVLLSQHGAGNIERWENVIKARDRDGKETTHPVIYAALGSHANYSRPEVIRSPGMYKPGKLQRFLFWFDGLIHYLFLLLNPNQKARQIAIEEFRARPAHFLAEGALSELKDEFDRYVVRLPMEIATGDGLRIGFQGRNSEEPMERSENFLKRVMSERRTTLLPNREWKRVLLNSEPGWVQYKGLWGVKSLLGEESGPPGPKWSKPKKKQADVTRRVRWEKPLDWLMELENNKH
ncbi:MAG: hypothetical protein DPW18_12670 [Chloroflexi bacterium]|nr:hypothetical protein [Chloroflexota bacterium]MDL1941890.1 hypothetical protein [Chloroflexi bacterium CFX2]